MLVHIDFVKCGLGYLDGGTGSMMVQAAIAGVLSMAFVAKTRWMQLKQVLASKKRNSNSSQVG